MSNPVRLGILGCGSVADYAILQPARDENEIVIDAVASRDAQKASEYAGRMGIRRSFGSYQSLLYAGGVDAIYIALPNSMHHEWVLKSLDAGYPVLCEKPISSNATQAAEMVARAKARGLALVEAFHWREHPAALRVRELVDSGAIGPLKRVEAAFLIPGSDVPPENIRFDAALGGGSLMDPGCYCVDLIRWFCGGDPEIVSTAPTMLKPQVDCAMEAELRFASGVSAGLAASLRRESSDYDIYAKLIGEHGEIRFRNPFLPAMGPQIELIRGAERTVETPTSTPSYTFQARAFAEIVRGRRPAPTGEASVENMKIIDKIYAFTGLEPRNVG